jgi:hypothetical protein
MRVTTWLSRNERSKDVRLPILKGRTARRKYNVIGNVTSRANTVFVVVGVVDLVGLRASTPPCLCCSWWWWLLIGSFQILVYSCIH